MIKFVYKEAARKTVSGNELEIGRAYRLTNANPDLGLKATDGNVYIRSSNSTLTNLTNGMQRACHSSDKYVEVDLEITVREKN